MRSPRAALLSALLLAAPAAAAAQDPRPLPADSPAPGLPAEVSRRIVAFLNDPATLQLGRDARVPAGRTLTGGVAAVGGTLTVAGRIEGPLVVVNGHLALLPGASVTGDVTVVGGDVTGLEEARTDGDVVTYSQRLHFRLQGDAVVALDGPAPADSLDLASPSPSPSAVAVDDGMDPPGIDPDVRLDVGGVWEETEPEGRSVFRIGTGQSYNRVEGLPITVGPAIRTGGSNPTVLRAQAIFRTEQGLALGPERWGYDARLEQYVGGHRRFRVGGALRSVVDPIEPWGLSKLENSLSTFFLHRDYRDHYEREGWSLYGTWAPEGGPLSVTGEVRSERHRTLPAGSPWTLFDNDEPWRSQPLVGEGRLRSAVVRASWDTRNEKADPTSGWFAQGTLEQALESDLRRPEALPYAAPGIVPSVAYDEFTYALFDVRRYNRISPTSRLNLRLLAGGSVDGTALPPQRQHALGGEATLPGYDLFQLDCRARAVTLVRPRDLEGAGTNAPIPTFHPEYGCDRFVLLQAEYRGTLSFGFDWGGDDDGGAVTASAAERGGARAGRPRFPWRWDRELEWVAFFDAGRGGALGPGDEDTSVDFGFGVLYGRVGLYGAIPLVDGRGINVFIRLNPRF
jgi:hypothetical protein